MAKTIKPPVPENVDVFIARLDAPFDKIIAGFRKIFLSTDKEIAELIKWNAPCFVFTGDMKPFNPKTYKRDIAVVNLHKGSVLIVFPTGAVLKDGFGLLEDAYPDGRRMARVYSVEDLAAKEKSLIKVIKAWLKMIDK